MVSGSFQIFALTRDNCPKWGGKLCAVGNVDMSVRHIAMCHVNCECIAVVDSACSCLVLLPDANKKCGRRVRPTRSAPAGL